MLDKLNRVRPASRFHYLRWCIGGLLMTSTIINYIDRQTVSVLGPTLKAHFNWSYTKFAWVLIAFRLAYGIGQMASGKFLDRVGTRVGLMTSVTWYSIVAALTSLTVGFKSLISFRFLLGLGESANWPGATKAVSEWFPRKERGWAVALFDSGSSIGAAIAPVVVLWMLHRFQSWKLIFLITGSCSLFWVFIWWLFYHPPETHPRISQQEREMILADRDRERIDLPNASWFDLLKMGRTWGIIIGRAATDPVWYFIAEWLPTYLTSRKISLETGLMAIWVPFLAADFGNFVGGGVSSWLVSRGWSVLRARKFVIIVCGIGMGSLAGCVLTSNVVLITVLVSISNLCYASWSTMALALPSDLYPREHVASVSGLSGGIAALVTVFAFLMVGLVADYRNTFSPILVVGAMIPLIGTAAVLILVRPARALQAGS